MRILVQLDGLLFRFGEVVPDSIAMIEDIRLIDSRVRAAGSHEPVDIRLFRLPGDRNEVHAGPPGTESLGRESRALRRYFDLPGVAHAASDDVRSLADAGHDTVVLTTSISFYRRCIGEEIEAIRIADNGAEDERFVPYADAKRILEERLRIPTARPMRAGVRTGGLVALECKDSAAAWEQALELVRRDRNADWVVLGSMLILYTEEPDLEDSLVDAHDAERLSLAVNKNSLVIEENPAGNGPDPESELVYRAGGFVLRQIDNGSARSTGATERVLSWDACRRRRFAETAGADAIGEAPKIMRRDGPPPLMPVGEMSHFADLLRPGDRPLADALREVVSPQISENVSPDCYYDAENPVAALWAMRADTSSRDDIVALVYRLNAGVSGEPATVNAIAGALAISHWLEAIDNRVATFHCFLFDADVQVDDVFNKVLFADERSRLSAVVEFNELGQSETPLHISSARADDATYDSTIIAGGGWCQAPVDVDSVHKVQNTLFELLTHARV